MRFSVRRGAAWPWFCRGRRGSWLWNWHQSRYSMASRSWVLASCVHARHGSQNSPYGLPLRSRYFPPGVHPPVQSRVSRARVSDTQCSITHWLVNYSLQIVCHSNVTIIPAIPYPAPQRPGQARTTTKISTRHALFPLTRHLEPNPRCASIPAKGDTVSKHLRTASMFASHLKETTGGKHSRRG